MSALQKIRVVELAETVGGEYCGKLLADFGAEVIKIERPVTGSPTRSMGPFLAGEAGVERSGLFAYLNTNKRSVALSAELTSDIESIRQLIASADVVIDDHDGQFLAKLGLSPESLETDHPNLILCSITDFGLEPPEDRKYSQDLNVFHSSGWGYHTPTAADPERPPLNGPGRFLPSYEGGMEAALCVVAALFDKDANVSQGKGAGRYIEVSKQEVLASRVDYVLAQMIAGDLDVGTHRTAFDLGGPAGIFACRDGFAYIWMSAPSHWEGLRQLMDDNAWMDDDFPENWMERGCTPERVARCRQHLGAWLKTQDKHDVAARAQKLGVTLVAVNNAQDLLQSEQYQHRGFFQEVEHPVLGRQSYPTVSYKLSATPAQLTSSAPLLGQDNEAILSGLKTIEPATKASPANVKQGGPLAGLRVVELTKVWAGPYVGKLLAYLGAEVIRIESEGSMDVTRVFGVDDINNAPGFKAVNPQKLSAQINMKTEKGIELLLDLISKSDIVVENLRPGAIGRLGLGYDRVKEVKPDIIYVSMGMFGNTGPLAYQTGYAPCFAALSGLTSLVGYEGEAPAGMNVRYADSTFGAAATYAALVALKHRQNTGEGQFIDVSAVECMSSMIGDAFMDFALNGEIQGCSGNHHREMAPHSVYRCSGEDWLCIAVGADEQWAALAGAMGRPELASDARFASGAARKSNEGELDALIGEWTASKNAAEVAAELQLLGVAATKSQSSVDLIADFHLWGRGFYRDVRESDGSERPTLGPGWQMSRPAEITRGAPNLGEHNAYIFGEVLGLSDEERNSLYEAGITR